jgi:GntR family transcriptional regulator
MSKERATPDRSDRSPADPPVLVPIRAPRTLVAEVTANLRRAIQTGVLSLERELPAEPELARQLGVSRGTLRAAIATLEHEGLLARHQGVGTFIVPHTKRLTNVLNRNYGISELVRGLGGTPGTRDLTVSTAAAKNDVADKLGIEADEPVVIVRRVRTAGDMPVARTIDFLSVRALEQYGLDVGGLEAEIERKGSLYAILRDIGLTIDGAIADIRAVTADRDVASALQVKVGFPLLLLSQIDYAARGDVVLYSDEYLPPQLPVQVWRRGPA